MLRLGGGHASSALIKSSVDLFVRLIRSWSNAVFGMHEPFETKKDRKKRKKEKETHPRTECIFFKSRRFVTLVVTWGGLGGWVSPNFGHRCQKKKFTVPLVQKSVLFSIEINIGNSTGNRCHRDSVRVYNPIPTVAPGPPQCPGACHPLRVSYPPLLLLLLLQSCSPIPSMYKFSLE